MFYVKKKKKKKSIRLIAIYWYIFIQRTLFLSANLEKKEDSSFRFKVYLHVETTTYEELTVCSENPF